MPALCPWLSFRNDPYTPSAGLDLAGCYRQRLFGTTFTLHLEVVIAITASLVTLHLGRRDRHHQCEDSLRCKIIDVNSTCSSIALVLDSGMHVI